MKRLRWLSILMAITLLIIIGFQGYWLKDNYNREKRTLQIKTGVTFQETVQHLQAAKLKLPDIFMRSTSPHNNERIFVEEIQTQKTTNSPLRSPERIIKTTFTTRNVRDTLFSDSSVKRPFLIVLNDSSGLDKKMLSKYGLDSNQGKKEIFFSSGDGNKIYTDKRQVITTINILRSRLHDSLRADTVLRPRFSIRLPRDSVKPAKKAIALNVRKPGNTKSHHSRVLADSNNTALRILYSVDSLQDSLQLPEISKAFSAALKKQELNIPFSVNKLDSAVYTGEQDLTDVTVGFAKPVTYRLLLGNTASYLVKKISLPILFSLFLVGITVFSFVLLYRNLLRQQKLAEIKNEFISNISHELKTPIATVGIAIEALKNFNALHDPQKTKEYLDISSNELQRLGLLVDKVLKLSMFEKKEVELNKEVFDIKVLTLEVMDTMKLQFDKNKAVTEFTFEGKDFVINADKLHITSVVYNLLDNALKYRNENTVIGVHLSALQNNIELRVSDNGIGIAPEYQLKIFDKFFRVPTGNRHVVKGYGLGLSYVSHIITQHKGTIEVESEINKGSTFIIKIPARNGKG